MFGALLTMAMVGPMHSRESTAQPFVSGIPGLVSQLCVERLEDGGAMNGHPGVLKVYDDEAPSLPEQSFTLAGGQSACVTVLAGRYVIVVTSRRFDGPASDNPALPASGECHSLPYKLTLKAGERVVLEEWPAVSDDGGYSDCGWDVLPRGTPQPGNCEQPHNPPECADRREKPPSHKEANPST